MNKTMRINATQLEHLAALGVADAAKEYDPRTRREWKWKPHLSGPKINARVLDALRRRKLAQWLPTPTDDLPATGGRVKITAAGKRFLTTVLHGN